MGQSVYFFNPNKNLKPSWFGLPLLVNRKYIKHKENFSNIWILWYRDKTYSKGNFLNQPSCKLYNFKKKNFKNSQEIEDRGFFIGLPTNDMPHKTLNFLTEKLLRIKDY